MTGSRMQERRYVVAPRRQATGSLPTDWAEQLARIPGVVVVGRGRRLAFIEVACEAVESMRAALDEDFLIEEEKPRRPSHGA